MYVYDEKSNCWIKLSSTLEYQKKRRKIRDLWIVGLVAMLAMPLAAVFILALFGVFISLAYLDESEYHFSDDFFEF